MIVNKEWKYPWAFSAEQYSLSCVHASFTFLAPMLQSYDKPSYQQYLNTSKQLTIGLINPPESDMSIVINIIIS